MSLNLRELHKSLSQTDKIITGPYTKWLLQHGDDEMPTRVGDLIREQLVTPPRIRSKSLSSSSAGQCHRSQVLTFLGASQGATDARLQQIFNDGKWRHLRWQACLLAAGIITEIEYPLEWPARRSRGTMDGIGVVPSDHPRQHWRGEEFGFELKGISTYLYPKIVDGGPMESCLNQTARYFLSGGFDLFSIVYEDKSTQHWTEHVIVKDDVNMKKRIEEQRIELEILNEHISKRELPPMLPECESRSGPTFKDCNFGGNSLAPCPKVGKGRHAWAAIERKKKQ